MNKQPDDKWVEHQREIYKQTNQACIEYSIKTLWALFILNGLAATAILGAKIEYLFSAAILFGFGAILAVLAFAASYIYSLMISETWRPEYGIRNRDEKIFNFKIYNFSWRMSDQDVENARVYPVSIAITSVLFSISGLILCWIKLYCIKQ